MMSSTRGYTLSLARCKALFDLYSNKYMIKHTHKYSNRIVVYLLIFTTVLNIFALYMVLVFIFFLSLNRSARSRVYACKWTSMVYHIQMAKFWSILRPRTKLIDRKCCIFNEEKDNVFGLWSKI
jgi:hypothetical protein